MKAEEFLEGLDRLFPDAKCELHHRSSFELAAAVLPPAQTPDAAVNRVTPALFEKYPTPQAMGEADIEDLEKCIASLGLYRNKAKSIKGMAKAVHERFGGVIPERMEDLVSLPGIGRKCANVILAECYGVPALAVDTHVSRVAKRLKFAKEDDSVTEIEKKLCRKIPRERWIRTHHQMIFFGRYLCHARNPECGKCPFTASCREYAKKNRKKGS